MNRQVINQRVLQFISIFNEETVPGAVVRNVPAHSYVIDTVQCNAALKGVMYAVLVDVALRMIPCDVEVDRISRQSTILAHMNKLCSSNSRFSLRCNH